MSEIFAAVDHIAYAVRQTDAAIKRFSAFHPEVTRYREAVEGQNVVVTYLAATFGGPALELVEPVAEPNPVSRILANAATALYHVCYSVYDFDAALVYLKDKRFLVLTQPFHTGQEEIWAAHVFQTQTGIIEIVGPRRRV